MVELHQIEIAGDRASGFHCLVASPANKAAGWKSMGYDPYDYYDLGEFDQKGGVPTCFASKADLLDLIESTHALGLQVYADLVFNHNSGADVEICSAPTAQIHYQPGAAPQE
jgi:alpha-amylase